MVETGVPGLEQTGWDALRGQLNTLDTSLLFLALLTGCLLYTSDAADE